MCASEEQESWLPLPARLDRPEGATSLDAGTLRRWQLVLTAVQIESRIEQGWRTRQLLVPKATYEQALYQLQRYEQENRDWPPQPPETPTDQGSILVTLSVVILAASFFNLTQSSLRIPQLSHPDWYSAGSLYAGKVRNGELWRTVTALTLHADLLHLAGNAIVATIFIERLRKLYGSGLSWSLFLLCGAEGNLVNAWLQPYHHQAVGASTAVFGLLGVIATDSLVRNHRFLWRRWALPLAAACALLGLLGTSGENTDLGAHLWGFLCGLPFGVVLARTFQHRAVPGRWSNRILGGGCVLTTCIVWGLAVWR